MNCVPEIRRQKILIPPEMTSKDIIEKYGLSSGRASTVKKQGFFVKNYSKKQIICDPEHFDPAASYNTAWKVFWKNFSKYPIAMSIKDDLIQESVIRMYELSGKVKERANGKYSVGYGFMWVAHNAMLSYLKTWCRQNRGRVYGDLEDLWNV